MAGDDDKGAGALEASELDERAPQGLAQIQDAAQQLRGVGRGVALAQQLVDADSTEASMSIIHLRHVPSCVLHSSSVTLASGGAASCRGSQRA